MSAGHCGGVARYGLPGLMAGLILAWWGGGFGPAARAQGTPPGAESNGTIAFTTVSAGSPTQMLYLIDTKAHAFAIYRVDPINSKGTGSVKLEAARQYSYDLKLREFNNQPPEVHSIEQQINSMPK